MFTIFTQGNGFPMGKKSSSILMSNFLALLKNREYHL